VELTVERYLDMRINQNMTKRAVLIEINRPEDYAYLIQFEKKNRLKPIRTQLDAIGMDVFIKDYGTLTYQEMADKYDIPKATVIDYANQLRKQGVLGLKKRVVINQYKGRD